MESSQRNLIQLCGVSIDPSMSEDRFDAMRTELSAEEQNRAMRFRFERDRILYIASHGLLRWMLSSRVPLPRESWRYDNNAFGKPFVASDFPSVQFNISHSEGMVVCATAFDWDIGVDVENHSRKVDLRIAERFFSPPEVQYLEQSRGEEAKRTFFRIWTSKESYVKARGIGIQLGLDRFAVEFNRENPMLGKIRWLDNSSEVRLREAFRNDASEVAEDQNLAPNSESRTKVRSDHESLHPYCYLQDFPQHTLSLCVLKRSETPQSRKSSSVDFIEPSIVTQQMTSQELIERMRSSH